MPKLSATEFNALYSAYSFPNTVLPFFGGYLVDKLGCRKMIIIFTALLVVGQSIFALGSGIHDHNTKLAVMLTGRIFYGFGGESLCVGAQTMLADWFLGKEMALAMGINLSISRVGSVVNDQTSVLFYKATDLPTTLWIGVIMVGSGLLAAVLVAAVDKKVENSDEFRESLIDDRTRALSRCSYTDAIRRSSTASVAAPSRSFVASGTWDATAGFGGGRASSGGIPAGSPSSKTLGASPSKSFGETSFDHGVRTPEHTSLTSEDKNASEEVSLSDIKDFKKSFWLICAGCVVVYSTVLPFNNIASGFISHKYYPGLIDVPKTFEGGQYSSYKSDAVKFANTWMMVPFVISAVLSPFLGGIVDRIGCRSNLMLVSAVVLTVVHFFFAAAPAADCPRVLRGICCSESNSGIAIDIPWYGHPAIGLVFLGIAYAVYAAAIWPAIVYVVKENQVGTAYGLVTAVQNSGLAIVPLVVGALTEQSPSDNPSQHAGGYLHAEYFFVACGVAGCVISAILITSKDGQRLNKQRPDAIDQDAMPC